MSKIFGPRLSMVVLVLISSLLVGCGSGEREEEYGTVEGTVKHGGNPVPSGAQLILEDKANGVRKMFPIGEGGKYSISETAKLPAGTYAVAVAPPSTGGVSEANYEDAMSNPNAAAKKPAKDAFPVPENLRDPEKSGKTVDVKAGSQTIDIEL